MSKYLIIPDVHGRTFWQEAANLINDVERVIFLGDYLDPYPWERINSKQAICQFKEIIKFSKNHPGKVILLLGNHDCAYCYNFGNASRYDYENEREIKQLFDDNIHLFRLWYLGNNGCLFSHAGVTNYWLKINLKCKDMEEFIFKSDNQIIPYLWKISPYRGGYDDKGSIIWSDVREFDREETFYQVFGHTQLEQNPIITDKWACLDIRRCFLIDTETKEITESNGNKIILQKDYLR